jgi:hypothetical protein
LESDVVATVVSFVSGGVVVQIVWYLDLQLPV